MKTSIVRPQVQNVPIFQWILLQSKLPTFSTPDHYITTEFDFSDGCLAFKYDQISSFRLLVTSVLQPDATITINNTHNLRLSHRWVGRLRTVFDCSILSLCLGFCFDCRKTSWAFKNIKPNCWLNSAFYSASCEWYYKLTFWKTFNCTGKESFVIDTNISFPYPTISTVSNLQHPHDIFEQRTKINDMLGKAVDPLRNTLGFNEKHFNEIINEAVGFRAVMPWKFTQEFVLLFMI